MVNKNNKNLPRAAAIALALFTATPAGADGWGIETAYPVAVLQGLDKITARISTLTAPVDQEVRFGSLWITPRA